MLPRGHQRPPDGRDRAGRDEPGRPADAQPGAAVHRSRARLLAAAGDDAPRPRPLRRPALRHARRRHVRRSRERPTGWRSTSAIGEFDAEDRRRLFAFARDLLNSDYAGHRLTFQLFAQSPAVRPSARGLQQLRLRGPGGPRPPLCRASPAGRESAAAVGDAPARVVTVSDLNVVHAAQLARVVDRGGARRGRGAGRARPDRRRRGGDPRRRRSRRSVPTAEVLREWGEASRTLDATGMTVLPGLIECHSHPLFAGSRHAEYPVRLGGRLARRDRARPAAASGSTVLATRERLRRRADRRAPRRPTRGSSPAGVTTLEVKSGYGLTAETRAAPARAAGREPLADAAELVVSFLGAHVVPPGVDADAYTAEVLATLRPYGRRGSPTFHDITCEAGLFTPEQARQAVRRLARARHPDEGARRRLGELTRLGDRGRTAARCPPST